MPAALEELCRDVARMKLARGKRGGNGQPEPALEADLASAAVQLDGPPSGFICPECGGSLWEMSSGKLLHYQCHVGHAFSPEALVAGQDDAVEEAMWTALRTLEETAALRRRLADDARTRNLIHVAVGYEERAQQVEERAGIIRKALLSEKLPRELRGFGSSEPAKFLSRQAKQHGNGPNRSKKKRDS
jgi:hypothetical protein